MTREIIYIGGKKIDLLKESPKEYKERVSDGCYKFLSRERVVPDKTKYTRKLKHKSSLYN